MPIKQNYIAGAWTTGSDASPNINPSDISDIISEYAVASADDANAAIDAAYHAFPSWRATTPQQRADYLDNIGAAILAQADELGHLLSREEGKTLAEGIGETVRAGQLFKFYAQEALRNTGDLLESIRPGVDIDVTREPLGVVGLITPWNFPIAIPSWKIAPALAYGNTVVLKPAALTPGCAHRLAEIIAAAGLPEGVFNLVMGSGSVIGSALTNSPRVNAISFTGSVPTGKSVAAAALTGMKKIQMEMGGKNPMVVMNDADLDIAVDACLNGAFFSTGQRCTASSRLIVEAGIHDAFVEAISKKMADLNVGHALAPTTQIGPVVSANQLRQNLNYVEIAKEDGATVVGGEPLLRDTEGYYQQPALFVGSTNQMRSAREEIFGPCASVIKVADFDEAVSVANDTEFGLSSGICTTSLKLSREFKKQSAAGMVMVNLPTAGVDYHVPFGGRKGSSYGSREQGRYAAEFYTNVKTAYTLA